MEAKGNTESWFYLRARAIADGTPDPMPTSQGSWEAVLPDSHLSEGLNLVSNDVPKGSKRR